MANWWSSETSQYLTMSPGTSCRNESSLVGAKVSYGISYLVSKVGSFVGFMLGGPGSEVVSIEPLELCSALAAVRVEYFPHFYWIHQGRSAVESLYTFYLSLFLPCRLPWHGEVDGSTPSYAVVWRLLIRLGSGQIP